MFKKVTSEGIFCLFFYKFNLIDHNMKLTESVQGIYRRDKNETKIKFALRIFFNDFF